MSTTEGGYVVLTLRFFKEDEQWVGVCEELQVSTYAEAIEVVSEELDELVLLTLNGMETLGERERFFADHGITLHSESRSEPEITYTPQFGSFIAHSRVPVGA